jgi:hypothetical protein
MVRIIEVVWVPLVVTRKYLKCVWVLKFATQNVVWEFGFRDIRIWVQVFLEFGLQVRFLCLS